VRNLVSAAAPERVVTYIAGYMAALAASRLTASGISLAYGFTHAAGEVTMTVGTVCLRDDECSCRDDGVSSPPSRTPPNILEVLGPFSLRRAHGRVRLFIHSRRACGHD